MSRSHHLHRPFVVALTIGVLLSAEIDLFAAVERVYIDTMVANAPVIVVATVETVEGLQSGRWKATGRVIETLKGPTRATVTHGPSGSGEVLTCDISAARVGETVVLLLEPERDRISELLLIAGGGRGRLPIHMLKGAQYVEAGGYFLHSDAPTVKIQVGNEPHDVVPLEWLRKLANKPTAEVPSE